MAGERFGRFKVADRRDFLRKGAACGAAAALGWCAFSDKVGFAAAESWKMRLSCSSINFASLPIEKACERIAALGFEAIDIWSPHANCPHLDDVQARLGPSGLQELLQKNKLKLYAFSVYRGGFPKYADLLGKVGGGVAVQGSAGACKPDELSTRMKAFMESLKPLIELAEKTNSYVAIENHGGALLHTVDSFKAFVDANKSPRVGIALAPYHLQTISASIEEVIEIAGKQLFFFYAWNKGGGKDQLPGHNATDCRPWLKALAKIGYRYYVNPFMHHEPAPDEMSQAMGKSVEYLKECYRKEFSVGR